MALQYGSKMNREIKLFISFVMISYSFSVVSYYYLFENIYFNTQSGKTILVKNIRDSEHQLSSSKSLSLKRDQLPTTIKTKIILDYKLPRDQIYFKFGFPISFNLIDKFNRENELIDRSIFLDVPPIYMTSTTSTNFYIFDPHAESYYYPSEQLNPDQIKNSMNQIEQFIKPFELFIDNDFFFPKITFGSFSPSNGFSTLEKSSLLVEHEAIRWEYINAGIIGVNLLRDWDYLTTTISHSGKIDLSIDYYYDDSCLTQFQNSFILRNLKASKDKMYYFNRELVLKKKLPNCALREITIKTFTHEPQTVKMSHNGFIRLKASR